MRTKLRAAAVFFLRGRDGHADERRRGRAGRNEAAGRDQGRERRLVRPHPADVRSDQPDAGLASFCCWTARHVVRNGQAVEINNPKMTLTGKRGTLVARNKIGYVDLPDGWAVFTGTWKIISGTGAYAWTRRRRTRSRRHHAQRPHQIAVRRLPRPQVAHRGRSETT